MKLINHHFPGSTFLLLIASLLAFTTSFAQKNLQPGYIVTSTNDTLKGFFDYRNWEKNPSKVDFYHTHDDVATAYTPKDVNSFRVSGETYKSAVVTIDQSPYRAEELKEGMIFNYVTETVFLLNLIQGEKNLYYLMDENGKTHFFITNNSAIELLLYKRYFKKADNGNLSITQNKKYVGQLNIYLQDCSKIQSQLGELKYDKNDLVKLFQYYYECSGNKLVPLDKAVEKNNEFGFLAGLSFTKLHFYDGIDYFAEADYPVSTNFSAGLYYNLVFPRNFGRMSINNELIYYSFKTESSYKDEVKTTIGLNYLMVNILLRYKYPVKKVDLFVESGLSFGYGFNETNTSKFEDTNFQDGYEAVALTDFNKSNLGANLGIGVKYQKFSIGSRYMYGFQKTNSLSVAVVGSKTNTLFLMLGYQF